MNKESILFGLIGLVAGTVLGFMYANSINRSDAVKSAETNVPAMTQNAEMPAGHPTVTGNNPTVEQMEKIPEVQKALEQAKAEPGNFDAQMKAAGVNYQIGKYDAAIEILLKANTLKPEAAEPLIMLGNAYYDMNKYADAEKWYLKALEKKPKDVSVLNDLGLTYVLREPANYDRAIQEFNKSLAIDPNQVKTMQNLTVALAKKGDLAAARTTLAKIETADPTNTAIPQLKELVNGAGK